MRNGGVSDEKLRQIQCPVLAVASAEVRVPSYEQVYNLYSASVLFSISSPRLYILMNLSTMCDCMQDLLLPTKEECARFRAQIPKCAKVLLPGKDHQEVVTPSPVTSIRLHPPCLCVQLACSFRRAKLQESGITVVG